MSECVRPAECFAEDYSQGRRWFSEAVRAANGELDSRVHPVAKARDGGELSIDVAWFGPRDANRVFVSISGTHGLEYYAGAAGQLSWILSAGPKHLPEGVAVCLIHALNPYGAAHFSRGNEHFVDLNRNYQTFESPVRSNPYYEELHTILFTADVSEGIFAKVMDEYDAFMARTDPELAMTAMGGGQDSHPDGLIFSGTQEEWSTRTLRSIVSEYLLRAEKVALIDWHTGLGPFAKPTVLLELPNHTESYRWACTWWDKPQDVSVIYDAGVLPDFVGHVNTGIADELRQHGITVANTVIEFGTVDNRTVIPALLVDRWLRFECTDRDSPHAVKWQTIMMERFNPSQDSWRRSVLSESNRLYESTIRGLAAW